jgi:hypothetical protein
VLAPRQGGEEFVPLAARGEAEAELAGELARVRREWPDDSYGESFHGELTHVVQRLLARVYEMKGAGDLVAAERVLPAEAVIDLPGGQRLRVTGRMDLVRLDRAGWRGARVQVVDFKTGGDAALSAGRMARSGAALQLGVYLAALRAVGATAGDVRMLKPDTEAGAPLAMEELDGALARLADLGHMLERGIFGALTAETNGFGPAGWAWPLASTPIPQAILRSKWGATFGEPADGAVEPEEVEVTDE